MNAKIYHEQLLDSIDTYYQYNPDTLMPLLMLALATQGKLRIASEKNEAETVLCSLSYQKALGYDWVQLDPGLKKNINKQIAAGIENLYVCGQIDSFLKDIYGIFHHYDTFTVEEEYHHRIGILYQHSSNRESDSAHRQYAMISLAKALLAIPSDTLGSTFLKIANRMLVLSGLQPERPRIKVAYALNTLLQYDGEGRIYNPFAGCAIAAAMVDAGAKIYADGNANDKLFAVARLLNYGMGGSNEHYEQRDSTRWIDAGKFDYVMCTYRGYVNGISAFDFCLEKCFDTLSDGGKFAGIVAPKDIFENQSAAFKEALDRDWVETIALLPFGEVAVLVNARKDNAKKSQVRFFDMTNPMLSRRPVQKVLCNDEYAIHLKVSDVKKKGYLRKLVIPKIEERSGYEIVKLGDLVKRLKRQTFSLSRIPEKGRVMASIDRRHTYNKFDNAWMNGISKRPISSLFSPAYHLKADCLITNANGMLEPRLFDADNGSAYFQDGYAFEIKGFLNCQWLIEQLNEPYVLSQLHPYGMDKMVPEHITEAQILNLKLYRVIYSESDYYDSEEAEEDQYLPTGFILHSESFEYTIHNFLGNGNFGYAYSAESHNLVTGEKKELVLKEFYPHHDYHRENGKVVPNNEIAEMENEDEKYKFRKEFEIMQLLGNTKDSHIVPALDFFESEDTGTMYYVMPFYESKSLDDYLKRGRKMSEKIAIENLVIPLCKALHTSQKHKVLHLDINPKNVLIDDDNNAILSDFGTAKTYNEEGDIVYSRGKKNTGPFTALEQRVGSLSTYDPRPDMYGIAATIYICVTSRIPDPIMELGKDEEYEIRDALTDEGCSTQFADALVKGLQGSMSLRPKDAQAFLNLFPGCEKIKLK